jgi:hypothetical protein
LWLRTQPAVETSRKPAKTATPPAALNAKAVPTEVAAALPERRPALKPSSGPQPDPCRRGIRSLMPLRRFLSFRDFDWWLLCLVLVLCVISVLEIYSTTVHTRFASFESKQIFFIAAGMAAMFILSRIDYHRLIDWAPWMPTASLLFRWSPSCAVGHKALGARRWIKPLDPCWSSRRSGSSWC